MAGSLTCADLPGIGPQSAAWLTAVGVRSLADLQAKGCVAVYVAAKNKFPKQVSLNLLWGLWGAQHGVRWQDVPPEVKAQLKHEVDHLFARL